MACDIFLYSAIKPELHKNNPTKRSHVCESILCTLAVKSVFLLYPFQLKKSVKQKGNMKNSLLAVGHQNIFTLRKHSDHPVSLKQTKKMHVFIP